MKMSGSKVVIAALMPHAPVLVPAVGEKYGHKADNSINAMAEAARRVVQTEPDALVVISPHTPRQSGAFAFRSDRRISGSLGRFGAPDAAVDLPADRRLAETIAGEAEARGLKTWWLGDDELDHGATVPLWHLAAAGWEGPTVVIGLNYPGDPGLRELGAAIAAAAKHTQQRVAVIASGDMSHCLQPGAPCGFHPRAKEFDRVFIECVRGGDYRKLLQLDPSLQDLASEDAVDSTVIAAAATDWKANHHEVLSYEGPFGVGYGVAILHESAVAKPGRDSHDALEENDQRLPQLARRAVESNFNGNALPDDARKEFAGKRRAVFVTIRGPRQELRGCVGTLSPRYADAAEETWHVARDAAFRDGRFPPVEPEELKGLNFEVSVLSPLEEAATTAELDPQRYGVVVTAPDGRRGVLLPDLAGIDTLDEQVAFAKRKGGISENEPVRLQRFEVKKFYEQK